MGIDRVNSTLVCLCSGRKTDKFQKRQQIYGRFFYFCSLTSGAPVYVRHYLLHRLLYTEATKHIEFRMLFKLLATYQVRNDNIHIMASCVFRGAYGAMIPKRNNCSKNCKSRSSFLFVQTKMNEKVLYTI